MIFKTYTSRGFENLLFGIMALFLINATITIPRRTPPPPATVAIIKDSNLDTTNLDTVIINRMVAKAIDSALGTGGITNLVHSGNTVLIKPNIVNGTMSSVTDWHVVRALVNVVNTASPGTIIIAEASALNNTPASMSSTGYTSSNFPDVQLVDLNDTLTCPLNYYILTDGLTGEDKRMPAIIYNADVFISVPRMKTHGHCGITGALKNIGVGAPPFSLWNVPGTGGNNNKGGMHHDIRREIVEHLLCRVPDFALMDGIQPMQGNGPSGGTLLGMKLVIAGKDPVAVDAVACNIMGIPSFLINHQVLCANENIGMMDMSKITVVGNSIASVQRNFIRANASAPIKPYEPGSMPYRATTVIRPVRQIMNIDGDLSEWGYSNTITADASYQVNGSLSNWSGPADCSFNVKFLYDAQNLYVAVVVRDDHKQLNTATGAAIRNGECMELYLSTYPTQYDSTHKTYNASYDYCMGISYAVNPQTWMFSHNTALTGVVANKVETSDGYIIEAKIPWSNFPNFTLVSYREIGINLAVDDADNSPAVVDNKVLWANDAAIETNPLKMGIAYLDPAGGLYLNAFTLKSTSTNGAIATSPIQMWYDSNTVVQLMATPNIGYTFNGWSGDTTGLINPLNITMNTNKNITANFTIKQYSITLTSANGTVAASPNQIFYDSNTAVQLTATPANGYTFSGWSGDATGSTNPLSLTMNGNKYITAIFTIQTLTQYSITLTSTNGMVVKNPSQALYDSNSIVQLTATPNTGYTFTGWSGDVTGSTNPVSMTMNANKNISANFTLIGLPSPWATQDIGTVSPSGSAAWAADSFTVKGSGADIWGAADAFRFVSQSLIGDATIIARVATQSNSNGWAKSGIMFREALTAGAKHVTLVVTPSNGVNLQYRATTGGTSTTVAAGTGITAPIWLKLVHSGSTFTAYRSTDGATWTQAATLTQTMVSPLYAGLCVCSHLAGTLCTTVFKNVSATVTVPNNAPTIATAAKATPNPVTASTTALSVLGADDNGEANLTYTWATTGTPPAAVTFSANGTNAAKSSTATFTKAGSYNFQVTVKDQGNLTVTSAIAVTVNQTPTSIVVSPASATVNTSATQQFTAVERDQFATNLTTQPAFTWSVSGGGTINASGLFTAGTTAGGPYTVTAKSGSISGTGTVTVTLVSTPVYRLNSGGAASSPFIADQYYTGGTAASTTSAITTTGVTNPAPQAVYQTERYGTFSYTLPGLVAAAQYTVRLHFAEIYFTASGQRTFNVVINGTTVLTNYDIYAATGARYKAIVREFAATADAQGRIVINFNNVINNAKSSGIEIIRK
jgi:uncharacterized repeat protein (TIGR02543 family)